MPKVIHKRSNVVESQSPKVPVASGINVGEIAVNYAKGYETLMIKNDDGTIASFSSDGKIGRANIFAGTCNSTAHETTKNVTCGIFKQSDLVTGAIILVTFTYTNDASVSNLSLNVNNTGAYPIKKQCNTQLNNLTTSGELREGLTYMFQFAGSSWVCMTLDYNNTYSVITEAALTAGTATDSHTISAVRFKSGVQYWINQNENGFATTNDITAATQNLQQKLTAGTNIDITNNVVSVTGITIPTSNTAFTNDAGYLTSHQSLSGVVASVDYDSNSKLIKFFNSANTQIDSIDATDFIKDGMVSSVTVTGDSLVITFNTDAGREDISLSLDQIFDPDNYYSKTDTDSTFVATTAYTQTVADLTAHTANTTVHVTSGEKSTWNGKQDSISDLSTIRTNASSGASAYTALTAHTASTAVHLPSVTSSDNGKILQVVDGIWTLVTPTTIYTGSGMPSNNLGSNGDIYLQTS